MISPSPTQPPQAPSPERKEVKITPVRKRTGETPLALFIKALLRPIIKVFYYLIRAIRTHKLLTLVAILLLIASISATTYATTGSFPFGLGRDPFNFQVRGNSGSDQIKNWLYALRDGDVTKLQLLEAGLSMQQPPDPTQLVNQYSQPQGHITWTSINVIGSYSQSDTTLDSFVSIDFTGSGPGGPTKGIMIWHFVTVPAAQGRLLTIDLVSFRPVLQ